MTILQDKLQAVDNAYAAVNAASAALGAAIQDAKAAAIPVVVPPVIPPVTSSARTFNDMSRWTIQAMNPSRVTVNVAGDAVRLHTEPGDFVVSDAMERAQIYLNDGPGSTTPLFFKEGMTQWWRHQIELPDDFAFPTWQMYVLADFHNSVGPFQANFHVNFAPQVSNVDLPGDLIFRGYGGVNNMDGEYISRIGQVQKGVLYDFVYHMRWSATSGYMDAWMGTGGTCKRYVTHQGATLYAGQDAYLILANYHAPGMGPSSVIHRWPTLADNAADLGVKPLDANWQGISLA